MPQYQPRFLRDAVVVREDSFREPTPAAALKTARLRLGPAPAGEILVVLHDGVETARVGPHGSDRSGGGAQRRPGGRT